MAESIGITLLGHGVVGGGVVRVLNEQRELLQRRTGLTFEIRHVVVRDVARRFELPLSFTNDAMAAIDDPQTDIVVEVMGGVSPAGQYIEHALRRGKPVVTANKSLLAKRGRELFQLAREHKSCIAFEASCGGGIPIIEALRGGLIANRIDALVGIVNGTCNVILTRMTREGWTYERALKEAQELGFAEADPTLDVGGHDAAQKLAILASLAFNVSVPETAIHVEGIDQLQPADLNFARELGYVIKLLAIAERVNDKGGDELALRVHPTLVSKTDMLADVSGSFNAISVFGSALGHAMFYGRGAGPMPTASAVVADIVSVALGGYARVFDQLRIFPDTTEPARVQPIEQLRSRYYIRLLAKDQPGVLADVTDILGTHGISLSAVLQHEAAAESDHVPVVITTHLASEGDLQEALREVNALPTLHPPAVCLRIIDQPKEFAA